MHRGLTAEDARARIAAQATDEQRSAVADVVLDNSGTPDRAEAQVERFWAERVGAGARMTRPAGSVGAQREPGEDVLDRSSQ